MFVAEHALRRLQDAGLKLTPQRRAVIEALVGNRSHPSAEEVATAVALRIPGVSLSTVYKTLHDLASLGLVTELDLPGSTRFDPDTATHAHLVCSACGTVVDVELPPGYEAVLPLPHGMRVHRADLVLHGTCAACTRSES